MHDVWFNVGGFKIRAEIRSGEYAMEYNPTEQSVDDAIRALQIFIEGYEDSALDFEGLKRDFFGN